MTRTPFATRTRIADDHARKRRVAFEPVRPEWPCCEYDEPLADHVAEALSPGRVVPSEAEAFVAFEGAIRKEQ